MATSAAMDQFDKSMKKQIEAIARVLHLVRSCKEENIPIKIDKHLFLGSIGTATDKVALNKVNITHILTVADKLPPAFPAEFVYKVIAVADRDDVDLKQYFKECFGFINGAKRHGGNVLVHCFAGRSRSVTIIVAYLMKTSGMSFSEAMQHVRRKRPSAYPNAGFIQQLEDFEKSIQGTYEDEN
ncbi:hypothetical protein VNO77_03993 [Canavalia gladiata]|uniref:Dual specificity protein phosphatase 1 n=1 Tax=Canavalia gladiata TaxID=3824 RepID=A0AAN9MWF7_CANGL